MGVRHYTQYRLFETEDKRQAHGIVLRSSLRTKNKTSGYAANSASFLKEIEKIVGYARKSRHQISTNQI